MNRKLDVTIIILSFNSREVTDRCIDLALKSAKYCQKKLGNKVNIIVVDNASGDGSAEYIKLKYPSVKLLALKKNIGYGRGNNLAASRSKTPYILLLNSDAFLQNNTIYKSVDYMQRNFTAAAMSCKFLYPDFSFQASAGYLPTPFKTIRWAFGIDQLPLLKKVISPFYQYQPEFYLKERQIEWCPFAFFFMRREVLEKIHGFDPKLFLYMEDVELCQRMKKLGLRIYFTPLISFVHLGGFSSKKLPSAQLLSGHIQGLIYFHKKHYPSSIWVVKAGLKVGLGLRLIFYTLAGYRDKAIEYRTVLAQ